MRIGIFCPYNYFRPGGVQEHIRAQAVELRNRGHYTVIITPRPRGFNEPAPDDVYFIGRSIKMRAQSSTVDISAPIENEEIKQLFDDLKLDILHFHETFVPFIARQIAQGATCPTVGTLHAALPETLIGRSVASIRPYMRSALNALTAVTAVSPAATYHVEDLYSDNIEIIPNGIDVRKYKLDEKISRDPATVLFLGRIEKRKGLKYLIDAFELVLKEMPEAKLLVAGDGQMKKSMISYAEDRGIGNIKFLDFVDDQEKIRLMKTCTIYCSPAIYGESFGIVLLEAMALGAPIVAHNNSGYEWVMKETGRLSLVDVKHQEEFARRLVLFMQDTKLRELWQTWAKQYVKQFSYKNVVDQYLDLYQKILNS